MIDRIMLLEQELKLNRFNIIKLESSTEPAIQKEYRSLIIQRSNLKDMLLEQYRNEILERRKDYEYASGS